MMAVFVRSRSNADFAGTTASAAKRTFGRYCRPSAMTGTSPTPLCALDSRRRLPGRRMRLFARAAEARLHAFAQLLERDVEHRQQEDPDRTRGQHTAEHRGANGAPAKLRSTGGDDQR